MDNQFQREELLIGKENLEKLKKSKVGIFGIGGVGSFVVEGFARAGIGNLVLIDLDNIDVTNINRQIHSLHSTIGKPKIEVMRDRVLDINPNVNVEIYDANNLKNEVEIIDNSFTYIVDAVDTITTKLNIIEKSKKENVPIISCMGTANRLDPTKFKIEDIYKTSVCPLAKIIRKELRKTNIKSLKVLYSKEEPKKFNTGNKNVLSSISFVPSVAGLIISGEVIKDILLNNC